MERCRRQLHQPLVQNSTIFTKLSINLKICTQQTNLEKIYRKKGCDHKKKIIEPIIKAHNLTTHKTFFRQHIMGNKKKKRSNINNHVILNQNNPFKKGYKNYLMSPFLFLQDENILYAHGSHNMERQHPMFKINICVMYYEIQCE